MTNQIVFIVIGVVLGLAGLAFTFAPARLASLAQRENRDPYRQGASATPTAMRIGGILCLVAAAVFIVVAIINPAA